MKIAGLLIILSLFILLPCDSFSQFSSIDYLIEGKQSLKSEDFSNAEEYFTKALLEFQEIGDYILFWRARAYTGMNKYEKALQDLNELKKNYPSSPIIKEAAKEEIEIAKKLNLPELDEIYESFINEYPEEVKTKFEYAQHLKEKGEIEKAKIIFKDIFITATSFADKAEKELSKKDITINDLIKKSKALNNAYLFKKAEKYIKMALVDTDNSQKTEILSILGYSLFMQKRYSEAAEIFKECKDYYWRARALLRAKDYETFETELPDYIKTGDQRISEILINYANIKRRTGEPDEAINILKMVVNRYNSARENGLWSLGWNYYLQQEYEEAKKIFQELYSSYSKLKYLYWLERINELKGVVTTKHYSVSFRPGDIYSYLLYMKGKISYIPEPVSSINYKLKLPKRVDILMQTGFKEEVLKEIKSSLKNNRNIENIPLFSKIVYDAGDYPTSIRLISKIPGRFNYHDLLYPEPYMDIVLKASRNFNINPYLILAVMREESKFNRQVLSPAGALGLMQLMPYTAKREGKKLGILIKEDQEILEPETNILIGSFYLKNLIEDFQNIALAVAAYNAGEKAVLSWIKNNSYTDMDELLEDIPYAETKAYVQRVLTSYFEYLRTNKKLTQEHISKIIKIRGGNP